MGTSDGYVFSSTKVVDHGADALRFNFVILGDGYQAHELSKYHADVDAFVAALRAAAPFDAMWCAINIRRVDVVSTESGADDPTSCTDGSTGAGSKVATYFDSSFCHDGDARRLLLCDTALAKATAKTYVPNLAMTMVIVNDGQYGGAASGGVAVLSTHASAARIAIHEAGHAAFGLADEYGYRQGCSGTSLTNDRNDGLNGHGATEPQQPNVTINTDVSTIKWRNLLTKTTDPLPTTSNGDCTNCDTQSNPKAAAYVGAYEGAHYSHCGAYRAQFTCTMRDLGEPFCAVCQQAIRATLQPHLPDATPILITPSIAFSNIPEGLPGGAGVTTFRAVVFELDSCMAAQRHLRVTAGPTGGFGTPLGTTADLVVTPGAIAKARIWLSYTSTSAGATSVGSLTVHCDETGDDWVVPIAANTIARPRTALALVLDHSGSMSDDAGDTTSKVGKLRQAAQILIDATRSGDGLSITRFDDTAEILMGVTDVGPATIGGGRVAAAGHLGSEIDPDGMTSIGAGVVQGAATLATAQAAGTPHYTNTALLVLTDGVENTSPMLIDVRSSLTATTFAVGLGAPQNISVAALSALAQAHDGYLLVTGTIDADGAARLDKYFLQILAGATNANVVLDPSSLLVSGATQRIPFWVSDADYGLDVYLLCDQPSRVSFELETPDGTRIDAATTGNSAFVSGDRVGYYRLSLPALPQAADGSHAGRWHVVLDLPLNQRHASYFPESEARLELPYDVVVHAQSSLAFTAGLTQSSFTPGATATVTARVREYDVPPFSVPQVWAELTRPDGSASTLILAEQEAGRYEGSFPCTDSGVYQVRARARGTTVVGAPFQREQALSAAVYPGGGEIDGSGGPRDDGRSDGRPGAAGGQPHGRGHCACSFVRCLLDEGVVSRELLARLRGLGIDLDVARACIEACCAD